MINNLNTLLQKPSFSSYFFFIIDGFIVNQSLPKTTAFDRHLVIIKRFMKIIKWQKKIYSIGGFTLIEILIAMAISGVLLAAVCMAFSFQQRISHEQAITSDLMQSIRATFSMMEQDIRMAGYDSKWIDDNDDGWDDYRSHDLIDNDCDGYADAADQESDEHANLAHITAAEPHYIQFRLDRERDGDFCDSKDLIGFGFSSSRDRNHDGVADAGAAPLGRSLGGSGLQPVAEDIEAVAFGYAYDDDNGADTTDNEIDTIMGHIIWGYDADGDGNLDTLLDSNNDGAINLDDDLNGDRIINDVSMNPTVPVGRIRAVAIWLMVRSRSTIQGYHDRETYVVGNRLISVNDHYKRIIMTSIVYCRNLGLR